MNNTDQRSRETTDEQQNSETINCWRVYPETNNLFENEPTPSDNSLLIRQDEETEDYLRGYVAHPEFGNGLEKATFQKDKLVGWREETVVPMWPSPSPPLRTRVWRALTEWFPSPTSPDKPDSTTEVTTTADE